ncbi:MAG: isoprenylcysteine carboxylmethyltransferase family protein [Syntrophobacteraceae bacterium]|jgi:protein-S-isoprenylcysteine O-methyltransferase Ste14
MKTSIKSLRIDLGRPVAVAFFGYFMVINILAVQKNLKAFFPFNALKCLALAHYLLVAAFYVLVVALYLMRDRASATTRSFLAKLIGVTATFLPFLIPVLGGPAGAAHFPRPAILAISSVIAVSGMAFTLVALGTLGKSWSIIPQVRKLVVRGPYRLVRHPIYVGEITALLGLILARVTIPKILVFLLLVGCQVYRSLQEEKLLTAAFPEYADYAAKTARFLPGLF